LSNHDGSVVKDFVDIHTHREVLQANVLAVRNIMVSDLKNKLPMNEFFSLGYHPWEISVKLKASEMFSRIESHLEKSSVVLIGETGIDRSIQVPFDLQKELFELHVAASERLKKPLIIHSVRSYSDLISIKKSLRPKMPWIIHGFQSNVQVLEQLVNKGFLISFGPALLKDDVKYRKLLWLVPRDSMFFETDDSDSEVEIIYRKASELMNITMDELKSIVLRNTKPFLSL
jgi:TatD DNase family protein